MIFNKKIQCEKCDNKFSKEEDLMQHYQVVHNKDLPYDCKECNQFFFKYGRNEDSFTKRAQLQKR